ncbi:hypothetical protein CGCA056_v010061 [Colletotrichum aenigma]|uniref:uncharacterized protein n=1 Tax=Colletotrichum aenigma TaxID=1215731 RepID=UPI001872F847|nr:uncharacterized protein CGCA056_v010061 [Colletotrichum aenigma]KAF5519090.1 hypothetical protein CGCA056_v010061 [Colletotrichum aenigma]
MSTAMDIAATSTTIEPPLFDSGIEPLEGASGNTARTILVALCVDASTREKALRNYYRLMHYEQQLCGQELIRNASAITTTMGSTKRKAVGEPKICLQCDEIFTEDQNQLGACWYHSGELELMDESAIDREPAEMALYDLDTEPIRARHPEAFRWCCCRETGKARGCTPGRHESNPDRSKKGRGDFSDLDEDSLDLDDTSLDDDDDDDDDDDGDSSEHSPGSSNHDDMPHHHQQRQQQQQPQQHSPANGRH